MLPLDGAGRALDIGSGTGYTTEEVFGDRPTVCLDLIEANLDYYRDQISAIEGHPPTEFVMGSAIDLPFESESFKYILCSEVLEHLEDDNLAVAEIARVLQPDGKAVITVPYTGLGFTGFLELLRIKTVHDFPGPEFHVRPGYDEKSMTALLNRHGLEVDEYAYYLHFFTKVVVDAVAFAHLTYERVVKHRQAWTWAEAAEAESSRAFKVYTRLFPAFQVFASADRLLGNARGFGLVAGVRKVQRQGKGRR
jgi:SAM-dependent methyltransferase